MELSDRDRNRIAGLLLQRYLQGVEGKKLARQRLKDKFKSVLMNLPQENSLNLITNIDEYIHETQARCFGYGDSTQTEEEFGNFAFWALLALRYAEEDGVSLNLHMKRRLYAKKLQNYTDDDVYEFFCIAARKLLELMAPPKK